MNHIDYWYHHSQLNFEGNPDGVATHTDNIPDMEVPIGLDSNDQPIYEKQPDTRDFIPSVDSKRVSGHAYIPYKKGCDLWRNAANAALASAANKNFRNR